MCFHVIIYLWEHIIFYILVTIGCGGSASDNNTYIEQSSVSTLATNPCVSKICPCSTNICRIRFDFQTFIIAGPTTATTSTTPSPAGVASKWKNISCLELQSKNQVLHNYKTESDIELGPSMCL